MWVKPKNCDCPPFDCRGLVQRCLRSEADADDELVRKFSPFVRAIVRRVLGPRHSADWDDACQTVFLRLFSGLSRWRGDCPFCRYVAVIATRVSIDFIRKPLLPIGLADVELQPEPSAHIDPVMIECIEATVSQLEHDWQRVLQLKEAGVTHEEIGRTLGKSRRTIQNWLVQIRERLMPCVER